MALDTARVAETRLCANSSSSLSPTGGGRSMTKRLRTIATGFAALIASTGAGLAQDHGTHGAVTLPDAASATYQPGPPNLPKGTQISMVSGDPSKPGPFVLRVKFPTHTVIAPHTHSAAETLTILSGSIYHEHGTTIDKAKGKELRAGGFVFLPKDMPHSLWTSEQPVELQVNGSGPFGLNYIDPADDPSKSVQ
ncbi:cupin domain-containing protein [Methylobacterium oryzae]|uniref:cupin domain-containing protein n=1 Tax=Methylobacterium oryzae TaxID=334852 RepID=UPI002F356CA3